MPGGGPSWSQRSLSDHHCMNERRLFANPRVALLVVWHPLQTGIWEFSFPFCLWPPAYLTLVPNSSVAYAPVGLRGPGLSCSSSSSTQGPGLSSPQAVGEDSVRARGPEQGCRALPGQPRSGLLNLFHLLSTPDMSVRWRSKKGLAGEENHLVLPSSWVAGRCSL